jgi:hypothetical protein
MNLTINQLVLVAPKCGPAGGHEFVGRITTINPDGTYVVVDHDDDCFTVDKDEILDSFNDTGIAE